MPAGKRNKNLLVLIFVFCVHVYSKIKVLLSISCPFYNTLHLSI